MKTFISEYGRLIVSIIVIVALLGWVYHFSSNGKTRINGQQDKITSMAQEEMTKSDKEMEEAYKDTQSNNTESNAGVNTPASKYGVGTSEELSQWKYTIDKSNGTVTLSYYDGNETDVIIHQKYKADDGKEYRTVIANSTVESKQAFESNVSIPRWMFVNTSKSISGSSCYSNELSNNLKSITFDDGVDFSQVTDLYSMCGRNYVLEKVDFGNNDLSSVKGFGSAFADTAHNKNLKIDLGGVKMKAEHVERMFYGTQYKTIEADLTGIDFSNIDKLYEWPMGSNYIYYVNETAAHLMSKYPSLKCTITKRQLRKNIVENAQWKYGRTDIVEGNNLIHFSDAEEFRIMNNGSEGFHVRGNTGCIHYIDSRTGKCTGAGYGADQEPKEDEIDSFGISTYWTSASVTLPNKIADLSKYKKIRIIYQPQCDNQWSANMTFHLGTDVYGTDILNKHIDSGHGYSKQEWIDNNWWEYYRRNHLTQDYGQPGLSFFSQGANRKSIIEEFDLNSTAKNVYVSFSISVCSGEDEGILLEGIELIKK